MSVGTEMPLTLALSLKGRGNRELAQMTCRSVLFEQKQARRVWNEVDQKWYFAVQDVLEILTGSADIRQYVKKLKSRDPELNSNWGTICTLVEMTAADGRKRKM